MATASPKDFAPFHETKKVLAAKRAQLAPGNDIHPRAYNEFTIAHVTDAQARGIVDIISSAYTIAVVHKLAEAAMHHTNTGKIPDTLLDGQSQKFFHAMHELRKINGSHEEKWNKLYDFNYDAATQTARFHLPVSNLLLPDIERITGMTPQHLQKSCSRVKIVDHPHLHGDYMMQLVGQIRLPQEYETMLGGMHTHVHAEMLDIMLTAAARAQGLTRGNGISEDFPADNGQICDVVLIPPAQYEALMAAEQKAGRGHGK